MNVGEQRGRLGGRELQEGAFSKGRQLVEDMGGGFFPAARLSH
jgi:hypothetical protein